ncbi:MAG: hypothetical protein GXO37_04785 [Chloroflexi bacterium]|nr:hypothetical protein [Chloroflexota bacterium]
MKDRRWLMLMAGGGLVLGGALLRGGWMAASQTEAVVQVWLWLPWWPDAWQIGLLVLGLALGLVGLGGYVWQRRRARRASTPRSAGPSAFAVDPWSDTEPVLLEEDLSDQDEQVTTLVSMARGLEARGRLRAAREIYRQAYEIAAAHPTRAETAQELWVALRKLDRRLARQRPSCWQRCWTYMRRLWPLPEQ